MNGVQISPDAARAFAEGLAGKLSKEKIQTAAQSAAMPVAIGIGVAGLLVALAIWLRR
jgi:hypothetical protein